MRPYARKYNFLKAFFVTTGKKAGFFAARNFPQLPSFQVGKPEQTAWMINDKGNKVWFKFEHTPTLFPVKETRFYKPKLHRRDFLGKNKDDADDMRAM